MNTLGTSWQNDYHVLAYVKTYHLFYEKECGLINVIPTEECKFTMSNMGLLFKATQEGFAILTQKASFKKLLKIPNEKFLLTFRFNIIDPNFFNFTNIDKGIEQSFYFRNFASHEYLHENEFASQKDVIDKYIPKTDGIIELSFNIHDPLEKTHNLFLRFEQRNIRKLLVINLPKEITPKQLLRFEILDKYSLKEIKNYKQIRPEENYGLKNAIFLLCDENKKKYFQENEKLFIKLFFKHLDKNIELRKSLPKHKIENCHKSYELDSYICYNIVHLIWQY